MPTLSYGLNISKKPQSLASRPPPAKRKTIFDDDSGPEDGPDEEAQDQEQAKPVETIGGLQRNSESSKSASSNNGAVKPSKPPKISQYGDLSTNHATSKHAQNAQSIDPTIYDYDSVYDSLHAVSKKTSDAATAAADEAKKPKYMSNLLAAAEVRKRDQLRAKEKMLIKEREAEGDEFADKEKFVTAAYKRQQEEVRKAEAEEALREREAAERQRREGGGMKGFYKGILQRDEEKHAAALRAAEEAKKLGPVKDKREEEDKKKEKSEAELAKEKGAAINEDGQVVDKRQLLNAGLNAGAAPKPKTTDPREKNSSGRGGGRQESARGRETRMFEEQLLGKRGPDDDDNAHDDTAGRASKSRKMEDEILASLGL